MENKGEPVIINNRISSLSSLAWLVYFGIIYYIYSEKLKIAEIDSSYLQDLDKSVEFFWRITWGLSSILLILISTISIYFSIRTIFKYTKSHPEKYRHKIHATISLLTIIIFSAFAIVDIGGGAVSNFISDANKMRNINIDSIINLTMMLTAASTFLITSSSFTLLLLKENTDISLDDLKERYSDFKKSFYITSIFLCIGITQVYLLFTWASHATLNNIEVSKASAKMAQALTISGSIIYTIVFIILFVPVSITLNKWLLQIAEGHIETHSTDELTKWRKEVGLYITPRTNIGNLIVLLSPVLLGASANIISNIVSTTG